MFIYSPFRTVATAQLYFHLFFVKHTLVDDGHFPPMDIALTALLVACKAEGTYCRIHHLLSAAYLTLHPPPPSSSGAREGGETANGPEINIGEEHRQRVTQYEHLLLEAIQFEFSLRHAIEPLKAIAVRLCLEKTLVREAFNWIRRCFQSVLVLAYPPEHIALAALRWTCRKDKRILTPINELVSRFGIRTNDIDSLIALLSEDRERFVGVNDSQPGYREET